MNAPPAREKYVTVDKVRRPIDGSDLPHLSETLAAEGKDFDYVRVVTHGRMSAEVWKKIDTHVSKGGDLMADLAAPRLPGSGHIEPRRWSVTYDRLVFVDSGGVPLCPQPTKSVWRVTPALAAERGP